MARERFGIGQKVDVSHLGSMMWLGGNRNGMGLLTGNRPQRQDRRTARNPLWNTYKCKGGKWIAFSMNQSDRYWPDFCRGLDRLDLIEDERFSDMNVRADNKEQIIGILDEIFLTKTREEWGKKFDEIGGMIWERVQDLDDLVEDPQVIQNKYIVDFEHPVLGAIKYLQTPVGYSETPVITRRSAPILGENTEEILIETLGYTWDDIASMHDDGVIL